MDGSKKKFHLEELTAITILDGRNRQDAQELASYLSEFSLINTRVEIEIQYLIALAQAKIIRGLSASEKKKLLLLTSNFSLEDAKEIKKPEEKTHQDIKAVEHYLRKVLSKTSLKDVIEYIHIGLTSDDINNIAYRLMLRNAMKMVIIPNLDLLVDKLVKLAQEEKHTPMLGRTHGQAALPTILGKEIAVFAVRLNKEIRLLEEHQLTGKLTGAIGNLNALNFVFPQKKNRWINFAQKFISQFSLDPNFATTQINPYEDIITYFQIIIRVNGIILDLNLNLWRYISDGWFYQENRKGEVGSSTMPQKINPWRFENSEGNIGKAIALLEYYARKLATSRLQRDLSDSTIIRDAGAPLGYSLVAYKNTLNQLERIRPNRESMLETLNNDWSILSEAAQTLMRTSGVKDPYALMKDATRGKKLSEKEWKLLVKNLPIPQKEKQKLVNLTPRTYIGLAVEFTEKALREIKSSKKR